MTKKEDLAMNLIPMVVEQSNRGERALRHILKTF